MSGIGAGHAVLREHKSGQVCQKMRGDSWKIGDIVKGIFFIIEHLSANRKLLFIVIIISSKFGNDYWEYSYNFWCYKIAFPDMNTLCHCYECIHPLREDFITDLTQTST